MGNFSLKIITAWQELFVCLFVWFSKVFLLPGFILDFNSIRFSKYWYLSHEFHITRTSDTPSKITEFFSGMSTPVADRCGPLFFGRFFFFFFFFFACHPGGRSGRRTVPLPSNVNDAKKKKKKCVVGVPPPPPPLSDFFLGLAEFGFPALPFHKSWIRHCTLTRLLS